MDARVPWIQGFNGSKDLKGSKDPTDPRGQDRYEEEMSATGEGGGGVIRPPQLLSSDSYPKDLGRS